LNRTVDTYIVVYNSGRPHTATEVYYKALRMIKNYYYTYFVDKLYHYPAIMTCNCIVSYWSWTVME